MPESNQNSSRPDEGLFPTFFMAGFECSTFVWKDGKRKDYVALTGHDEHLEKDYQGLMELGIGVVREAIRWPFVDKGRGKYDWSTVDRLLDVLERSHISAIWDLCHYGFPDGFDPFSPQAPELFADYARASAEHVKSRTSGTRFFTPVNEITFFSGAGTDMGWMYPFAKGRYPEFKRALCKMDIEAVKAIRDVIPGARMVHVDPVIYEVPPEDRPDLADEAWAETYEKAYEAWDILFGKKHPELGGAPDILDIVGVNVYNFSQAEMELGGKREILEPNDPRRKPLADLMLFGWERYRRPMIIGETSGFKDQRAQWFNDTMEQCMRALNTGIDLQGVCLYPCVDIPDWNSGEWANIGIFDVHDETCERIPCDPYIQELRRWQKILDRPERIEPDHLAGGLGRVQLSEVREQARKWEAETPGPQTAGARAA